MEKKRYYIVLAALCALFALTEHPFFTVLCVAALCYLAVKNEKKLSLLCETDCLTKLKNRTSFERLITERYMKLKQVGVIIFDIDGLKQINDSLGHLEGDRLIRKMAESLVAVCDADCEVFRYGGDEFLLVCENAYGSRLKAICSKRSELCEVSASFGFAAGKGEEIRDLIRRADVDLRK